MPKHASSAAPKAPRSRRGRSAAKQSSPDNGEVVVVARPSRAASAIAPTDDAAVTARASAKPDRCIFVRGAREHNLKNIDVTIPRDRLVVITGLSGSGKSSLAFDTIFAEGQRKYMESLSAYARQFLEQLKKPDVDEIEGIPPTIAIEQRSASGNPRSTVATTTEIYDYLRLLYARCGTPYSWAPTKTRKDGEVVERAGTPISATSSTQIVDAVLALGMRKAAGTPAPPGNEQMRTSETPAPPGKKESRTGETPAPPTGADGVRIMVLAPVVRGKKGFHRDVLEQLQRQGWARARVNGVIVDLRDVLRDPGENPLNLGRYEKHSIDAVIDRIVLEPDARHRLAEAVEASLRIADGAVIISVEQPQGGGESVWRDHAFSAKLADPERPEYALEELSPRLFSFNSPYGACPECHGLGTLLEFDEALVIPNDALSLADGAVAAWAKNGPVRAWFNKKLKRFCKDFGVLFTTPVRDFDAKIRQILLHGSGDGNGKRGPKFEGVIPNITQWWETTENQPVKEWLGTFLSQTPCRMCHGDRLRIEALHVLLTSTHRADVSRAFSNTIIGRPESRGAMLNIAEFSRLTITDAIGFIENLVLSGEQMRIAEPILKEVGNRLKFLMSVGLEYLSLDRRTATLSGGEAQRIRLATQVGSGLVGACYVLDEPTIGLHQRDNDRLIATLRHLTDIGNTVLVVEHDEEMIRAADHVLDVGPGPGVHGGRIVAQGSIAEVCAASDSLTGMYLSGRRRIETPTQRRKVSERKAITIKGAAENNLKKIDAAFPIGGFICITGVSGSGKSTLVNDILLAAARQRITAARVKPGAHDKINGLHHVDRVIEVDQSPIGRTPRSNPATYTGVFDDIRRLFAQTKEAKIRGYQPGRFSFNVHSRSGGGRCEACQGQGLKKIEMHFLPDVYVECEICRGKRYDRETLEVLHKGKSIADVLDMTVEDACGFFDSHPKILRVAECLRDVGLDYITLGQPSTTLSGGEAQRVKLATELGKAGGTKNMPGISGGTLYILDEPTTGLHFEDIRKLIVVLNRLADAGNTLVVIEHNLDVIKCADWIIDLGPEGGDGGGRIIATGRPEDIAKVKASHTGRYLGSILR